jgi:pimeloyl-ACP methyl ester carboxylesterase
VDKGKLKRLLVGDLNVRRLIRSVFLILVLVYAGMFFYAHVFVDKIIFQPQPSSYEDTDRIIKLYSDGIPISAVYVKNPAATYTILYSHGNAEDIGLILPILEDIREMGYSVLAYDYRGYGTSSGMPSEKNAYHDIDAAYNYLVKDLGISSRHIIALGRSLGGAVAVDLAYRQPLGGLIIESSFVTASRVLTRIPLFPFDKFRSISKIKQVHCPVLVIHGTRDELIPLWHGEKLFRQANNPKLSFWVNEAGHNNLSEVAGSRYAQILRDFVVLLEETKSNQSGDKSPHSKRKNQGRVES